MPKKKKKKKMEVKKKTFGSKKKQRKRKIPGRPFKPGEGGRPKGAKNKKPKKAIRLEVLEERSVDYMRILRNMAGSMFKSDQKWFADHYARNILQRETEDEEGRATVVNINIIYDGPKPKEQDLDADLS